MMKIFIFGLCVCLFSLNVFSAEYDRGDINQDKHVNLRDFSYLAADWETSAVRSDIVTDGIVNSSDLMRLAEDWLKSQNPDNPEVTLQITGAVNGAIVIELYADEAPLTVENFLNYVQSGFYDGLIFHRVMPDFIVQGGGFDAELVEKPTGPPIASESSNGLSNLRGTIAMARTPSDPNSTTSQFFINLMDNTLTGDGTTNLDYGEVRYDVLEEPYIKVGYCVFGEVLSGMDVVDAIAAVPTNDDLPVDDVIIQSVIITQNIPFCAEKLQGDINGDCAVNIEDFAKLAENWMACNSITVACN